MADVVTLGSLGKTRYFCDEVRAGRGVLLGVLLQSGQEADATLVDRLTLAEVFAVTANKEAAWTGGTAYARKQWDAAALTIVPNTTNNWVDYDLPDTVTWANAGSSATPHTLGKFGVCFAPTAGSANTAIVPLCWLDYPETATGSDLVITLAAQGFYRDSAA